MADEDTLNEMSARMERMSRHQAAITSSDMEHLRSTLHMAADRFDDLAKMLEEDRTYDPVHFMRQSAARCRLAADNKS